ncbi:class I SAM-dependent methyltransferase [Fervidibacter sacchari]|uniref:SAM-dependent methyltransferase n=1 Tax=Candidatus Fervidibacter sacchari TaxID=1448929 RepID=A0ABT2EK88_9BACT|nr:class I SAM-dependent methyltransferase [Candidatus Fervidibacter sacchari]MCS3918362.1 SAM-dependent methyltransferase [Candidatus Fervidibacter sacchari]WKU16151.1 class I SAM-dependent methyltransferase [Candidatus Fervidibacter sacchari]
MAQWYREFFDDLYLRVYQPLEAPEKVRREVDFIVKALNLPAGAKVLDLCCGQGRHSLELARRGFQVVGVDLSEALLYAARKRAESEGLSVTFLQCDMREIDFKDEFDAVINMFTSFGYLESEAEDEKVLGKVAQALKSGGKFLLDVVNRDRLVRDFQGREWHAADEGWLVLEERTFDHLSGRMETRWICVARDGVRYERLSSVRLYTASELRTMLEQAGLKVKDLFGDYDGSPYSWDSQRLIVVACKP